jgi:hypothetical protein
MQCTVQTAAAVVVWHMQPQQRMMLQQHAEVPPCQQPHATAALQGIHAYRCALLASWLLLLLAAACRASNSLAPRNSGNDSVQQQQQLSTASICRPFSAINQR